MLHAMLNPAALKAFSLYWVMNGIGFVIDLLLVHYSTQRGFSIFFVIPFAFIFAACCTYLLNYLFVFTDTSRSVGAISVIAILVTLLRITWILLGVFIFELFIHAPILSRLLVGLIDGTISFFIDAHFTFRSKVLQQDMPHTS